jgi:hypothetical protein
LSLSFRIIKSIPLSQGTALLILFATHCDLQSLITLDGGALVQEQKWDGKSTTIKRKREDDKLVVVSISLGLHCCY